MNELFSGKKIELSPNSTADILKDPAIKEVMAEVDREVDELMDSVENIQTNKGPMLKPNQPDYFKPPKLEIKDLLNKEGEIVDFSQASSYHELIEMLTREGTITNQLGQELPAETVINLIYKLTYQDLRNYQKEDWTNITLRHNLRAAVARLIYEYKESDEFKALVGLDLSSAQTIDQVVNLINQKERLIDAEGNLVGKDDIIKYIKNSKLHLLPEPIRFKVIEINQEDSFKEMIAAKPAAAISPQQPSVFSRVGRIFSKLKFW